MLKYVVGDLVKDAHLYKVICHGCNCFCTMNSGIAPLIKEKFPEAYEVDLQTKKGDKNKLGTITFTKHTIPIVVNCYTQYDYKGSKEGVINADYKAIQSSMKEVKRLLHYIDFKFDKITEDIVRMLVNKRFEQEVDRKVNEKLKNRGKF